MKVLILGVSGMLGNAMLRVLSKKTDLQVYGSLRDPATRSFFTAEEQPYLLDNIDVQDLKALEQVFQTVKPDVVINCIGVIKQLKAAKEALPTISINALLPHQLAELCARHKARLVHFSTDCIFSGAKGNYSEEDSSDAEDLYGRSKFLGEVAYPHTITLRTSMIGHELQSKNSLIGWFLHQEGEVRGYTRAIFSGLPTIELARIVRDVILPNPGLSGLYHVSAEAISKYDLLKLVAESYKKSINIVADDQLIIDRSLNSKRFYEATGYKAPSWPQLIQEMATFS